LAPAQQWSSPRPPAVSLDRPVSIDAGTGATHASWVARQVPPPPDAPVPPPPVPVAPAPPLGPPVTAGPPVPAAPPVDPLAPYGGALPARGWFSGDPGACQRLWISGEYLLWWIKEGPLPTPLVTTGAPGGALFARGALGNPTTQVLFGGSDIDYGSFSGFRVTAGGWIDSCQTFGLEASGFLLPQRSTDFVASANAAGSPFLAVPLNSAVAIPGSGIPTGEIGFPVSAPGFNTGVSVSSQSRLWGFEVNGLWNAYRGDVFRVELLGGFRYLDLDEELNLSARAAVPGVAAIASLNDGFDTRNQFYGGQVGARLGLRWCRFGVSLAGKVALGAVHEVVDVSGNKSVTVGAFNATAPGGLFAQPTNIGRRTRDEFAVLPEAQVRVDFAVTSWLTVFAGYNFLYLNNVVRPGDQIDRTVNLTQLTGLPPAVGPARPAPQFNDSDFWAHGLNVGLEFRY
jgi:hypothetical protein